MKTYFDLKKHLEEDVDFENEVMGEEDEGKKMAIRELQFIKYAAEEIIEYLSSTDECEDWFKNKLTAIHARIQDLHSYIEGESRMSEDDAEL